MYIQILEFEIKNSLITYFEFIPFVKANLNNWEYSLAISFIPHSNQNKEINSFFFTNLIRFDECVNESQRILKYFESL